MPQPWVGRNYSKVSLGMSIDSNPDDPDSRPDEVPLIYIFWTTCSGYIFYARPWRFTCSRFRIAWGLYFRWISSRGFSDPRWMERTKNIKL